GEGGGGREREGGGGGNGWVRLEGATGAGVGSGREREAEGVVATDVLGGGPFVSWILRVAGGVFEVLATGGDTARGGDDFDHAMANWIVTDAGLSADIDPSAQRNLLQAACSAKDALTDAEPGEVAYAHWLGTLTREALNALIEPMVARSPQAHRPAGRATGYRIHGVQPVVHV
ncbi:hypothetical protein EWW49_28565, partial [Pseudomonas syringae]